MIATPINIKIEDGFFNDVWYRKGHFVMIYIYISDYRINNLI